MKYRIEISSVAEAEADQAFLQLSQATSPTRASQWYAGLLRVIESLADMPKRCPLRKINILVRKFDNCFMAKGAMPIEFSLPF